LTFAIRNPGTRAPRFCSRGDSYSVTTPSSLHGREHPIARFSSAVLLKREHNSSDLYDVYVKSSRNDGVQVFRFIANRAPQRAITAFPASSVTAYNCRLSRRSLRPTGAAISTRTPNYPRHTSQRLPRAVSFITTYPRGLIAKFISLPVYSGLLFGAHRHDSPLRGLGTSEKHPLIRPSSPNVLPSSCPRVPRRRFV